MIGKEHLLQLAYWANIQKIEIISFYIQKRGDIELNNFFLSIVCLQPLPFSILLNPTNHFTAI